MEKCWGVWKEFFSVVYTKLEFQTFYETLWSKGQTPWETSEVHSFLQDHSSRLDLRPPKRVLVPFCGNAYELKWFYEKGLEVVGIDFIEIPVKKFFMQHKLTYEVKEIRGKKVYQTQDKRLKLYVSSFYDMTTDDVGKFDIIWDKAVQLAVKPSEREMYSKLIKEFANDNFTYIMCTIQFGNIHDDPDQIPVSVSHEDSKKMFGDWSKMELICRNNLVEEMEFMKGFGRKEIFESCFLLTPK